MKSLKLLQVLAKIGKILSKIIYICCIVGFAGCVVGAIVLAIPAVRELGTLIERSAEIPYDVIYGTIAVGMLLTAGEGVLAKFAEHYFARELADGTPFTYGGAKELMRLGILTICIPLGTAMLAKIINAIIAEFYASVNLLEWDGGDSVGLGIMMLVMAALCHYGASLQAHEE